MNEDFVFDETKTKIDINSLLWEHCDPRTNLAMAEDLAVKIYSMIVRHNGIMSLADKEAPDAQHDDD